MTWIKICAMTNVEDARAAATAGVDAVGFVFAHSPRQVTPEVARSVVAAIPRPVEKIGVFADEDPAVIRSIVAEVGLTGVQLHGHETVAIVEAIRRGHETRAPRLRIFKTVSFTRGAESALRDFGNCQALDGILLDSVATRTDASGRLVSTRGGTGVAFNWKRAATFVPGVAQRTRVIVAGGLTPDTVPEAIRLLNPWGVDVCTGVELEPGRKDHAKMRSFVDAVRTALS